MDPITALILENTLHVRSALLAQEGAAWLATHAIDDAASRLPPPHAAEWRGPAAQAEAGRVGELSDALALARTSLQRAIATIGRDTLVVDLHVG